MWYGCPIYDNGKRSLTKTCISLMGHCQTRPQFIRGRAIAMGARSQLNQFNKIGFGNIAGRLASENCQHVIAATDYGVAS
jgi:hypothetical protein